jgi:hypothetical protein
LKGPMYHSASLPFTLKWQSLLIGETFRYTKSLTWNVRSLLLLSA